MKTRPSKLDAHAARLTEWFQEGMTIKAAQAQLKLDGCSVSTGRLSEWWDARQSSMQEEQLLRQIATGANQCREVEKAFGENPAPELQTIIKLQRVLILKISTQANANPELIELVARLTKPAMEFAKLVEKRRENDLAERKVTALEENRKQAKAELQKLRDPKAQLPEEDRKAIVDKVDEILGLK